MLAPLALILIYVTIYIFFDLFSPTKKSTQSMNDDLPHVFKDRQFHIQSVCEKHHERLEKDYKKLYPGTSFYSVISKAFLLKSRTNNSFLWCRVPKASSESWTNLFMSIW